MRHKTSLGLLLPGLLTASVVHDAAANDSAVVGSGGRWQRLQEGKTRVQMVKEAIKLELDQEQSYLTTADFWFKNQGDATRVTMGFPESGFGDVPAEDYSSKSGFSEFASWVDGRLVRTTRRKLDGSELHYSAFWTKQVSFGRGQGRHVRVRYRSPYGTMADPIRRFCNYQFTGGNWYGQVASSTLKVQFVRPGHYLVRPPHNIDGARMARGAGWLNFSWTNWQAERDFSVFFAKTAAQYLEWPAVKEQMGNVTSVTVPGKEVGPWDYLPAGFVRQGRAYLRLRAGYREGTGEMWAPEIVWSRPFITVRNRNKEARFSTGKNGPGLICVPSGQEKATYVPVTALKGAFDISFLVDGRRNLIQALP